MNNEKTAKWFIENNEIIRRQEDNTYLDILCTHAKVAFLIKGLDTVSNENRDFTNEEIHILKTINQHYGYFSPERFKGGYMKRLSREEQMTDDILIKHMRETIEETLKFHANDKFEEEALVLNDDFVVFVQNGTNLTNEEIETIKNWDPEFYHTIHVYRNSDGKIAVI